MVSVTMKELLEAGVHFGHQTKRWNPKMKEFIFGQRNGIYIIDLQKTIKVFKEALQFTKSVSESNRDILFVGTKKQAQDIIREAAGRCDCSYREPALAGRAADEFPRRPGERRKADRARRDARGRPLGPALQEGTVQDGEALQEAGQEPGRHPENDANFPAPSSSSIRPRRRSPSSKPGSWSIPVIAVVDTNGDPEDADYPIPGNDDAVRAIELFTSKIAEAVTEGQEEPRRERARSGEESRGSGRRRRPVRPAETEDSESEGA